MFPRMFPNNTSISSSSRVSTRASRWAGANGIAIGESAIGSSAALRGTCGCELEFRIMPSSIAYFRTCERVPRAEVQLPLYALGRHRRRRYPQRWRCRRSCHCLLSWSIYPQVPASYPQSGCQSGSPASARGTRQGVFGSGIMDSASLTDRRTRVVIRPGAFSAIDRERPPPRSAARQQVLPFDGENHTTCAARLWRWPGHLDAFF